MDENFELTKMPSRTELKEQRINELFDSCRDNVLQQITGPFGLTPAMFNDKAGGNVTTVHNFKEGVTATDEDANRYEVFKENTSPFKPGDSPIKEARKKYDVELPEKRKELLQTEEKIISTYTGKELPHDGQMHLDHVTPVSQIERDPRAMLVMDDEQRVAMANAPENLVPCESNINQSMRDKDKDEWAKAERKKDPGKTNAESFGVDEDMLEAAKEKSDKHIDKSLFNAQFKKQGQELLATGAQEAGKNALRQATGLLLHELVNGTYIEIKRIVKEPTLQDEFIEHVIDALKKVAERIQSKFDHIFNSIVSGGVQGFISNFLTFLINNLVTTSAKVVTIIRESMKGLWEAIKLVINPPEGKGTLEVAREATKIIAGVVTMGLGLFFEKSVEAFILSIPLLAPMASVIAPAATAILTGLATALVVYGIDRFFDWLSRTGAELLNAQIENMEAAAEMIERMAQFIQVQFDNSRQYQLCIEQYRKIEFELSSSQRNMHSALDYAESSSKSKEAFEEKLGVVKQLNNELADIEDLLRAYEKK